MWGIEVVNNKRGCFINVFVGGLPSRSLGPFDEPLTMPQALLHVGTIYSLEK